MLAPAEERGMMGGGDGGEGEAGALRAWIPSIFFVNMPVRQQRRLGTGRGTATVGLLAFGKGFQ